jgi:hypothetical protein
MPVESVTIKHCVDVKPQGIRKLPDEDHIVLVVFLELPTD